MDRKFSVGEKVVFVNDFGVCWGVKTIIGLDVRMNRPTYFYDKSDAPWFSVSEDNLIKADEEDLIMDLWGFDQKWEFFQRKYGWVPTLDQLGGCY